MLKLIELNQEHLIVCNNTNCDFKVPNETGDPNTCIKQYLNVACPKCGENLLTEEDYLNNQKLLNAINWMNKWFSWTTIFIPKKKKPTKAIACTHKGISIEVEK